MKILRYRLRRYPLIVPAILMGIGGIILMSQRDPKHPLAFGQAVADAARNLLWQICRFFTSGFLTP